MPLSDAKVRTAKPQSKQYKLSDEKGSYLVVTTKGSKLWRMNYRHAGKRKTLALGAYPAVSLAKHRELRDEARRQIAAGTDPSFAKRLKKQQLYSAHANSFEAVALEYMEQQANWSRGHRDRVTSRFKKDIFPYIGGRPVSEITSPEVLAVARRVEARGAYDAAHRVIGDCGAVLRYAIATARADTDPTPALKGALRPKSTKHRAAMVEPGQIADMLRKLDSSTSTFVTRCALKLAPLTFARPGELRAARWENMDLDAAEWRLTISKVGRDHIVPLSRQAVSVLRDLYQLTGRREFVFAGSGKTGHMSEGTVLKAMRALGISKEEMSGHGFRAMATTVLQEVLRYPEDLVEHQLSHAVRGPLGRAYNRTTHLEARHKMMQAWADYLDQLRIGANVAQLGRYRAKKSA